MSEQEASVEIPNALVFVECRDGGELPELLTDGPVTATASTVLVCTRSGADGPTRLRILDHDDPRAATIAGKLIHRQTLPVPSRFLAIKNVHLEELISHAAAEQVLAHIFVDDTAEPADVTVVISARG
jgi:hypothetical protein